MQQILLHVCDEKHVLLENVGPDGATDFSCMEGRLCNPGHAIEAGWFLLEEAVRKGTCVAWHTLHIHNLVCVCMCVLASHRCG